MDTIVQLINSKQYNNIDNEVKNISKEINNKLFKYTINKLINKEITQSEAIIIIYKLLFGPINLIDLKIEIEEIFNKLLISNNILISKFIFLNYNKHHLYNKLIILLNNFKYTNGTISNIVSKDTTLNNFKETFNTEISKYIKAFNTKYFYNILNLYFYDVNSQNNSNINLQDDSDLVLIQNNGDWILIQEKEILVRLRQMVSIFGIKLLKLFNIKIINILEFNEYSFEEKLLYIINCCINLKQELFNYYNFYNKYNATLKEIDILLKVELPKEKNKNNIKKIIYEIIYKIIDKVV